MAGDGGRVPDVSEQRAEAEAVARELERTHGDPDTNDGVWRHGTWKRRTQNVEVVANVIAALDAVRASDPASVLAALFAESPEATVAALEALLTSDEVIAAVATAQYAAEREVAVDPSMYANSLVRDEYTKFAEIGLSAACRSLLSKAPKEDSDA
jgi:hypothetical protein